MSNARGFRLYCSLDSVMGLGPVNESIHSSTTGLEILQCSIPLRTNMSAQPSCPHCAMLAAENHQLTLKIERIQAFLLK